LNRRGFAAWRFCYDVEQSQLQEGLVLHREHHESLEGTHRDVSELAPERAGSRRAPRQVFRPTGHGHLAGPRSLDRTVSTQDRRPRLHRRVSERWRPEPISGPGRATEIGGAGKGRRRRQRNLTLSVAP
jgi:hypothetical protein